MKHRAKKTMNKQFLKMVGPTFILLAGFGFSAYYLNGLSGQASTVLPPSSEVPVSTSSSPAPTTTSITTQTTSTTTQTTSASISTSPSQSQTTTTTSATQTTSATSTSATSATTSTTSKTTSATTSTTSKTTSTSPTPTSTITPTSSPSYTPGSIEDVVYKSIDLEVKPQNSKISKISIHIVANIPNAPDGYPVTVEIHSTDPIVIPTEVANGKIEVDVNQYVSPGNHELQIKFKDVIDATYHTITKPFIVQRIGAASSLNSSQYEIQPTGVLEILNPIYIYIIGGLIIASITILFIMYRSHDKRMKV